MSATHEEAARAALFLANILLVLRRADLWTPQAGVLLLATLQRLNRATPVLRAPEPLPPLPPPPLVPVEFRPHRRDPAQLEQEIRGSKELLLEILKRAVHDWVLYRLHTDLHQRQLAEDAYAWLFVEEPGHPHWVVRVTEDRTITAFVTICELLDLDPEEVRRHIRRLQPEDVRNAGRPPERRRLPARSSA